MRLAVSLRLGASALGLYPKLQITTASLTQPEKSQGQVNRFLDSVRKEETNLDFFLVGWVLLLA